MNKLHFRPRVYWLPIISTTAPIFKRWRGINRSYLRFWKLLFAPPRRCRAARNTNVGMQPTSRMRQAASSWRNAGQATQRHAHMFVAKP